ncbi:uncharacterized protein LOC108868781 [Brassica rapa]|uniref:uncharacterized protein LOC106448304 n=1 Tax=Brassica napus TaxID=3708 RepID=UPI0006AB3C77|nr:uncharacterized protein LOC106448304 [Brassica napus]XP_033145227.1 uncharacterized protein LOC108868781 [Brassica rapa]
MTISDETVITNSDIIEDDIFLSLAKYEDIIDGTLKTHFLIDVMGKIVSLEPVQTVQVKGEDRKKVQFRLVDSSGKDISCCLWGKYAEQLESYVECEQPLICLIRFAKISFYRGEVQITNAFDASIVYLDPTLKETLQFKEKLMEDNLPLSLIEKRNGKKEVENCKIICSIEAIDTDWSWFYFGHKGCKHRAIKTGKIVPERSNNDNKQLWHCGKCQANITEVVPVFKLHLIVRDDTETCKLMLLNTVGMTIVGHEAVDLWDGSNDEIEDPDQLPEPIRDLVGKSFCFGISVSSDNVTNEAETFKVLEVWFGNEILQVESQSEPNSMIGTSSSTMSSCDVLFLEDASHNESEECKTPFTKRKEEDADLPDKTSTSKKLCRASIKVEKEKEE